MGRSLMISGGKRGWRHCQTTPLQYILVTPGCYNFHVFNIYVTFDSNVECEINKDINIQVFSESCIQIHDIPHSCSIYISSIYLFICKLYYYVCCFGVYIILYLHIYGICYYVVVYLIYYQFCFKLFSLIQCFELKYKYNTLFLWVFQFIKKTTKTILREYNNSNFQINFINETHQNKQKIHSLLYSLISDPAQEPAGKLTSLIQQTTIRHTIYNQ